jgi:8-hydroxy-5-deazaflavin:NADPH oxidoreductase
MRIGIIGVGNMGRAIGIRFAHLGHEVCFGARSIERATEAAQLAGGGARAGTIDEAARHGEVLIWTVRELNVGCVLSDPSILDGKIVVDINNRDYQNDLMEGKWFSQAYAELLQAGVPKARIVKAFNVVAMESLDTSPESLRNAGAQVFIAGTDPQAKQAVSLLLGQLGFEAVDLGNDALALRAVEALGDVIRLLIVRQGHGPQANLQVRSLPRPDLETIGNRARSRYN